MIEVNNIGQFKNDFIAVNAAQSSPPQDNSNTPDEEDEEETDAPSEVHILVVSDAYNN